MNYSLKMGFYASLSLSRIFNTLGASIFNIVFVVFASSMPNPKFAIAVANFYRSGSDILYYLCWYQS